MIRETATRPRNNSKRAQVHVRIHSTIKEYIRSDLSNQRKVFIPRRPWDLPRNNSKRTKLWKNALVCLWHGKQRAMDPKPLKKHESHQVQYLTWISRNYTQVSTRTQHQIMQSGFQTW